MLLSFYIQLIPFLNLAVSNNKTHPFRSTYIVSGCEDIPDVVVKTRIVYFETVFHPVL